MILDPDPFDRPAVLAALREKRDDVTRRQRNAVGDERRRLWAYALDLQDAIWEIEQELGLISFPLGWPGDAPQSG
jgi:hypothetical protein